MEEVTVHDFTCRRVDVIEVNHCFNTARTVVFPARYVRRKLCICMDGCGERVLLKQ